MTGRYYALVRAVFGTTRGRHASTAKRVTEGLMAANRYTVHMHSHRLMSGMPVQLIASPVTLPLADRSARTGSPANDFAGKRLDVADLLVTHPKATFVLRVAGPSMQEHGIDDGDIVVVDRELRARDGSIVVAVVERELVIRVLDSDGDTCKLRAGAPTYPDILPQEGQTLEIWGVVTSCIKRFAR